MSFFERHNKDQDKSLKANDYFKKGIKFIGSKEYENAIEAWNQAIELDPSNVAFYIERGATYMLMGQFEKAIEDYNKVISLEPDEANAYTVRGALYAQLGNIEKAIPDFKKGSKLGDKRADEYLKGIESDLKNQRKYSVGMNRNLWQDIKFHDEFIQEIQLMSELFSKEERSPNNFLEITNRLDDIMQAYESKHGPIEDPIFFWKFALSTGLSLDADNDPFANNQYRIAVIINGYKEGLTKHLVYPSFTSFMIETALNSIDELAGEHNKQWLAVNRDKFVPIPE